MKPKYTSPKIKKIILIVSIIVGILTLLLFSSYLIARSYINKMTLVSNTQEQSSTIQKIKPEQVQEQKQEQEEPNGPDSSQDEITNIEDQIRKNMEMNKTPILYDEDVFNVLLIGNDSRKAGGSGRSDAMIIISINKKTKKMIATSLLRDIYLQIPGEGNNRLNAAYAYGSADLLMDTIEENFKIKIDRYMAIDFFAFIDVIDSIGGITLEVTKEEIPVINEYVKEINHLNGQEELKDCLSKPGTLLLNGKQALGYARNRYVGNADFERTARQRRVLEQVFIKAKKTNLFEINKLMNLVLPQVTTNLTMGEMFSLILSLPAYKSYSIEQYSVPMEETYSFLRINGMSVLGIDFQANIDKIHNKIYGDDYDNIAK